MREFTYFWMNILECHLTSIFIAMASISATTILFEILTDVSGVKKKAMVILTTGTFFLIISNLLTLIWEGRPGLLAHRIMVAANFLAFGMNLVLLFSYNLYTKRLYTETQGLTSVHKRFTVNDIILLCGFILLVISQFTGLFYTIDETNTFQINNFIILSFLAPISVLSILISLLIQYYPKLPKTIRVLMLLFTINPIIFPILELYLSSFEEFTKLEASHHITTLSTISMSILLYIFDLITVRTIGRHNLALKDELSLKNRKIIKAQDNMILSMAMLVESRDQSTGGHILRTQKLVSLIVDEMKKDSENMINDENFWNNIIQAAPLHDLGKIGVDDAILRKPGVFTPEEYEIMKTHAQNGAEILKNILKDSDDNNFKTIAINVAHYHHERWNGSGYPQGLKETAIPLEARIMAIADVYDALVSKRVYKEKMSFEKANKIILEEMGKQFDPSLKKYYLAARQNFEEYYRLEEEN